MSFQLKTIAGFALIQMILLFILTWYGLGTLESSVEHELVKRAKATTALFALMTANAVIASDLATLETAIDKVLINPDIVYARVLDGRGVLADGGDRAALARNFVADSNLKDAKNGVFETAGEINVANERFGSVELGFSIQVIDNVLEHARKQLLIFAALAMVLGVLFSYVLSFFMMRGLAALNAAYVHIASGNFGYQAKVCGKDEIAQAMCAFNNMSNKLALLDEKRKQAEQELLHLNAELEERVKLRTTEILSLNKELEHQSLHDPLTHLPNRTLYQDRIHQAVLMARRDKTAFTVIALDLDRFKQINDTFGHHTGDLVLQEAASRMTATIRQSDTVARIGGDEFALLLLATHTNEEATVVAHKLLEALAAPMIIDNRTLDVGASIGIAIFPKHGDDFDELIRRSDFAMYVAKRNKSGYVIYDSSLDAEDSERHAMQMEVRQAIFQKAFTLYYQPKIDFSTHRINGVEALARWPHPRLGLLFPDTFIPIVEKNGLMKQFTIVIMEVAFAQSAAWRKAGREMPIAVNISATNLQDISFPQDVSILLEQYEVLPASIELEITETAIMSDPLSAIANITKLSEMGLQISIDDFGTGYSSMAYLRKLLVAKIKIDKSFVMDMENNKNDEIIVRSTVDLGHNLGLKVVAEGVETQAAWDKLKEMGCDSAQGYFMGRPVPADELELWMTDSSWGILPEINDG